MGPVGNIGKKIGYRNIFNKDTPLHDLMYIEFVQHSVVFARAVYLGAVFLGAVHLKYLLLHKTRNISKFHHV